MGDSPQEKPASTRVSPLTQYTINLNEDGPVVPFFEAHAAAMAAEFIDEDEVILAENDFTIWQPFNTPREVVGLSLTPP